MPSFNETFKRLFIGTKATTANANQVQGLIVTSGLGTEVLQVNTGTASTTYGVGSYGFFGFDNSKSVTTASIAATAPVLMLASASLQTKDTIAPFYKGMLESNKSKGINPKYIASWKKFAPCTARQHTIHVGHTKYTSTLSPTNSSCDFTFLCGEAYYLRIEVRNEPVRHFLNRDLYRIFEYKAPCCADGAPADPVDGTLAFIDWAKQIIVDPELKYFVTPIVYSEAGNPLYPPGTTGGVATWDNYVSPGHVAGKYAGIRLQGSYVDTVFGDCSFWPTDYFNKVPVMIFVNQVDFNGDQCAFTGLCVVTECLPLQGNGFGDTILKEEILYERYRQNTFVNDPREREILLNTDVISGVDRTAQYYRYSLTHSVPRPNNWSQSFSSEQYTLDIISTAANTTLETFVSTWLSNAGNTVTLETFTCGTCTPVTP